MKRRILCIILSVLMLASLAACGSETAEPEPKPSEPAVTTQTPAETPKPETSPEQTPEVQKKNNDSAKESGSDALQPTSAPEPTPTPPPAQTATVETAQAYIGSSAAALAAAIGQPNGKNYTTSCQGEGEDGEWHYSDFTVFTYRDANGEQVVGAR